MSKNNGRFVDENQIQQPVEEKVEEKIEFEEVVRNFGRVASCEYLRVRSTPDASENNNIVTELKVRTEVEILDNAKVYDDFYRIVTEDGIEGYCLTKFIERP